MVISPLDPTCFITEHRFVNNDHLLLDVFLGDKRWTLQGVPTSEAAAASSGSQDQSFRFTPDQQIVPCVPTCLPPDVESTFRLEDQGDYEKAVYYWLTDTRYLTMDSAIRRGTWRP